MDNLPETWDWVAIASAIAGVASAAYAGWQARIARREADTAKQQLESSRDQTREMEKANSLAAENLRLLAAATELKLRITARTWGTDDALFVGTEIQNNSQMVAHIQKVYIQLSDGTHFDAGLTQGGLEEETDRSGIGMLLPGKNFAHEFCIQRTDRETKTVQNLGVNWKDWANVEAIVVAANNGFFKLKAGEWLEQIHRIQGQRRPSA
jgi:hypothetical protein